MGLPPISVSVVHETDPSREIGLIELSFDVRHHFS